MVQLQFAKIVFIRFSFWDEIFLITQVLSGSHLFALPQK